MGRLPSWSYVNWCYELTGNWATWEPGKRVEPGAVGSFDRQLRFNAYRTLADYGIVPRIAATSLPGSRLVWSDSEVHLDFKASGESSSGFAALGTLDAGAKVTAKREHACVLHMRDLSEAWIRNIEEVLVQVKALLLKGQWEVDSVVVVRRLEARQGFAAVSLGSGKSFEAKLDADARVIGAADLGSAALLLAPGSTRGDFLVFNFGPGSTPVFSQAIRVKRDLWDRLLPWRRSGGFLIAPDGRTYRELPDNLSGHALEARRYDPGNSPMPPGRLSAIAVADLFEDVVGLPAGEDERHTPGSVTSGDTGGRLLSFPLPVPPVPAALAAAGPAGSSPPVGGTVSPDGLARFTLLDQGNGEYWLEVSVAVSAESPLIIRLRYTTTDQRRKELLVPVSSSSASVVALPGYDGGPWRGWSPAPPASVWSDSSEMVEASVRAAVTSATVRAWESLAAAAPEYGRELIIRAINAPGAEAWW
jgi:hypothetical protein